MPGTMVTRMQVSMLEKVTRNFKDNSTEQKLNPVAGESLMLLQICKKGKRRDSPGILF